MDVVLDQRQVADQRGFDVFVVPDEANQKLIAEVEQFFGEGAVGRNLFAVFDVFKHLEVDILSIKHTLFDVVAAVPLIGEIDEGLLAEDVDEVAAFKAEVLLVVVDFHLVLDDLAHHVDDLHDACAGWVEVLLVDGHVVVGLVGLADDLDDGLVLHDVEFLFMFLYLLLEGESQVLADKELLGEGLDALLAFEQDPLDDGDGAAGEFGVVVLGEFDHLGDDGDVDQIHVFVLGELLDEVFGGPVVDALVEDACFCLQGSHLVSQFEGLEGLAGRPHRQIQVVVQNLLYYVHALQLAVHHQTVLPGCDAAFSIVGFYAVVRHQDLENHFQYFLDVFFGLPEAKVQGLPNEPQVLIETFVLQNILGVDRAVLVLQFIQDPIEDLHEGLGLPGFSLLGVHHIYFLLLEKGVVGDPLFLLDGVVGVAFDVEVVEESNDGGLCLFEGLVEEEIGEDICREHALDVVLDQFVPAFGHICQKVDVLHKVGPGGLVLLLANLLVVVESPLFDLVFVYSCVSVYLFLALLVGLL